MKWERYNKMSSEQKEEYSYLFTKKIDDAFLLTIQGMLIMISGLLSYYINKKYYVIFLGLLEILIINILTVIIIYKRKQWLKTRGI